MAGKTNISEFNNESKLLTRNLSELEKQLTNLINQVVNLNGTLKQGQTTQKQTAKNTQQLTNLQKERIKATEQTKKVFAQTLALQEKGSKQLIKAQISLREARKKARIEAEKELGITKTKIPFNERLAKSYQGVIIKLGLYVAAIASIIKGFKSYLNLSKEINKQTRQTADTFNLTRNEATVLTKEIRVLSAAYDKEFNDVLKSANILSKEFGISGKQSLDLINEGFEKGADVNGEFLELLKEYPAQLKSVGFNAEQTIAIITQTERAGVFSDKGIDAIKEAGLRLREMTPAAKTALKEIGLSGDQIEKDLSSGSKSLFDVIKVVSSKLGELPPQSRQVGQAIADIFGGPGEDVGLRFLTTLKDIDLELGNISSNLSDVEKSQISLNKEWEIFRTEVITGSGKITNSLTGITNLLTKAVTALRIVNLGTEGFLAAEEIKKANDEFEKTINFLFEYNSQLKIGRTENEFRVKVIEDEIKKQKDLINELDQIRLSKKNEQLTDILRIEYAKEELRLLQRKVIELKNEQTIYESTSTERKKTLDELILVEKQRLVDKLIGEKQYTINVLNIEKEFYTKQLDNEKLTIDERVKLKHKLLDIELEINKIKAEGLRETIKLTKLESIQAGRVVYERKTTLDELILAEKQRLVDKLVNEQEYFANVLNIEKEFYKNELDTATLTIDQEIELRHKILDVELEINQMIEDDKKRKHDEEIERINERLSLTSEIGNQIFEIGSLFRDAEMQEIENQRAYELKLAGDNEKKREQIEEKFDKKSAELKRKQAVSDKANAIFNAAINTAVAVTKSLPNTILAAIIATLGAIQIAAISAKPIPKFKEGTKGKLLSDTLAITGDGGVNEIVKLPDNSFYQTPAKDTLTYLPKGSQVYPDVNTFISQQGGISEKKMDELIKATNRKQGTTSTNLTSRGLEKYSKINNTRLKWQDTYIRK